MNDLKVVVLTAFIAIKLRMIYIFPPDCVYIFLATTE